MSIDMDAWRRVVTGVINSLADEAMQRRAWFGKGPEVSSPDEAFNQFFGDAAIEAFLVRADNGLDSQQLDASNALLKLMRELSADTPQFIDPVALIDDPRWMEVQKQAAQAFRLLSEGKTQ